MANKYIDFKYNRMSKCVDIDFNAPRVIQHLKALIRGVGSSTENIVLDFINNTTSAIEQYDNVQQAWAILDNEQKAIIDGFRSLMSKAHIGALEYSFCHHWYCNVISDKYIDLLKSYESQMNEEVEDINVKILLANQAEQEVKLKLTSIDGEPIWSVEVNEY